MTDVTKKQGTMPSQTASFVPGPVHKLCLARAVEPPTHARVGPPDLLHEEWDGLQSEVKILLRIPWVNGEPRGTITGNHPVIHVVNPKMLVYTAGTYESPISY
jgi:hypothetical protein